MSDSKETKHRTNTGCEGDAPQTPLLTPPTTARESALLESIKKKEYEEGDPGKLNALQDLQDVFDELTEDNNLAPFDVLGPYKSLKISAKTTAKDLEGKGQDRSFQGRKQERLTIPARFTITEKNPPGTASDTNLRKKVFRRESTSSLPSLHDESPRVKEKERKARKGTASRKPAQAPVLTPVHEDEEQGTPQDLLKESLSAIRAVQHDLDLLSTPSGVISIRDSQNTPPDSQEGLNEPSSATSGTPVDLDNEWRSDINRLTRAKATFTAGSSSHYPNSSDTDTLQMKYKAPIWPHQKSLSQILHQMPFVTCIILDKSELQFLRDLGSFLPTLTTLSISRCGLSSLDGLSGMPNLRTLIASQNSLKHCAECSFLSNLYCLDVSENPIEDIGHFGYLKVCSKLKCLKLLSTPVAREIEFHRQMKKLLPQVKELFPLDQVSKSVTNLTKGKSMNDHGKDSKDPLKQMMRETLDATYQRIVDEGKPQLKGIEYVRNLVTPRTVVSTAIPSSAIPTTAASTDSSFDTALKNSVRQQKTVRFSDDAGAFGDASDSPHYDTEVIKAKPSVRTETADGDTSFFELEDSSSSEEFFECSED